MAMLLTSEQVAGAADLQIAHRDFKAAAEFCKFPDRRKALLRNLF